MHPFTAGVEHLSLCTTASAGSLDLCPSSSLNKLLCLMLLVAGPSGRTALHIAVSRSSKEAAELLLSKGADINAM